jgi:uncharacterized membrane protein
MKRVTVHGPEAGSGARPGGGPRRLPAWQRATQGEHRWPVAVAIAAAVGLQLVTPETLAFQPTWLLPSVESLLLIGLFVANPYRVNRESSALRGASMMLVVIATVATAWSVYRLVVVLVTAKRAGPTPTVVLASGAAIWLTNVIVFALWYWELDRGGPAARAAARKDHPDFLFPQMATPDLVGLDWEPEFIDYLYVAFTNATAFSPTDTMPLSRWAKLAMMVQSGISVVVMVLVIARAVNILGS